MAPRPDAKLGGYLRTINHGTIRCKLYTAPPYDGAYVDTLPPGTWVGPIEAIYHSRLFAAVQVDGHWINFWRTHYRDDEADMEREGTVFAYPGRWHRRHAGAGAPY